MVVPSLPNAAHSAVLAHSIPPLKSKIASSNAWQCTQKYKLSAVKAVCKPHILYVQGVNYSHVSLKLSV